MPLTTTPNLESPDDFYELLIDAHKGLSTFDSHALNARLVLILSNHIGRMALLREALDAARASAPKSAAPRNAPENAATVATADTDAGGLLQEGRP